MLIKPDGTVWAAGRNLFGQLGDGTDIPKSSFTQVLKGGARDVVAGVCVWVGVGVSRAYMHTYTLTTHHSKFFNFIFK